MKKKKNSYLRSKPSVQNLSHRNGYRWKSATSVQNLNESICVSFRTLGKGANPSALLDQVMGKHRGSLVTEPVYEKENSESKPAVVCEEIDLCHILLVDYTHSSLL